VAVRLLSKGSCASVWFRYQPFTGYQVRICEAEIRVGTHKDAATAVLRAFPQDDPVVIGGPATRITLRTHGDLLEVARDGQPVGSVPLTDEEITGGRVLLGIFTEPADQGHPPPYSVAFDQVDVYGLR
jgi:hypothetical protein